MKILLRPTKNLLSQEKNARCHHIFLVVRFRPLLLTFWCCE